MSQFLTSTKNIFSILWQDFINLIHLPDPLPQKKQQREMVEALRNDGIVFIEEFLEAESCDSLANKLLELTSKYKKSTQLENGAYINFRNENNKDASDHGMIDIMYVDNALPEIKELNVDFVTELLEQTHKQEVIKLKTHAYVNRGVKGTRTFHIDNTQPLVYKAFVYLTDVEDETYGPYSFIKGSQKLSFQVYKNLLANLFRKNHPTDMVDVDERKLIKCIAPKGTMIISNQNGIHRGMPQGDDKTRIALVFNFTVLSKLSYLHKTAREKLRKAKES
mgnify:CR=1 FL=1